MKIQLTMLVLLAAFSAGAQNNFFKDANEKLVTQAGGKRVIIPAKYRTVSLDTLALANFLKGIPSENNVTDRNSTPVIEIPMPDGSSSKFHIWESSIMAPELAARFPQIKTFTGQGIDDRTANIKIDWTELGFHAMILSPVTGSIFIDPYAQGNLVNYISYFKVDFKKDGKFIESGFNGSRNNLKRPLPTEQVLDAHPIGQQLRKYRLAIACTHQYAIAATGFATPTVAQALSTITTTVNRVDGVYELELDIRLVLIATETSIIFPTAATDPFTANGNSNTLINQSQTQIDAKIGDANYDIGHTFSTGAGGLASLGVVCVTGIKSQGVTGTPDPVGDPYDIDFVAHEMGHEFGANHPFSGDQGSCGGNQASSANAEPGSGSTIMAYAGICDTDDLQLHSDANFHAVSFNEITEYTINGDGNSCPVITNTGNTPPVVTAPVSFNIPKSTYFDLTGSATDINGDALTYSWEQTDVGGPFGAWNSIDVINSPISALFRSFAPVTSPTRHFPKIANQVSNTSTIGELLPSIGRTMHFRLTVRDNRAGGGGVSFAETAVKVDATAGPFLVTYPTASAIVWYVNDFKTITWNPSGTQLAPVSCSHVNIQLSTDGGNTFPITLLANTPNDGTEEIRVPNNLTTKARIRIMAAGNIFYDISDNNFNIVNAPAADFVFSNPSSFICGGANNGTATLKTGALGSFAGNITLSSSGNPAGTTVSFGTNPSVAGNDIVVTLNNSGALVAGIYNVTIKGVSGAITKTRVIAFNVQAALTAPSSLTAPVNNAVGVGTLPAFTWATVTNAVAYKLEISVNNNFSPVAQSITNIVPANYTLTTGLGENTIYYWRVSAISTCGTEFPSSSSLFKTGVSICNNTATSSNVPKTISATGTPTVTSTITMPAASSFIISDVNVVGLKGTHSWVPDLTFRLISPANTNVLLFNQICDNGNEYTSFNLNLDDQAATGTFPCPPTGNVTIRPTEALAAFNGENSSGVWTLNIKDNFSGDGGSLTGWGLSFCAFTTTPIPVTWVDFAARKENNFTSTLSWSVNEYNNDHYDIERSIDGVNFIKIGEMPAGSRSNGNLHQYLYNDMKPVIGINYYRLKQVDLDGHSKYSVIVNVVFDKVNVPWTVYPNPVKDKINIVSNRDDLNVSLHLFDASGKLIYQNKLAKTLRGEVIPIMVDHFARGVYTLQISSGSDTKTEKILLQ